MSIISPNRFEILLDSDSDSDSEEEFLGCNDILMNYIDNSNLCLPTNISYEKVGLNYYGKLIRPHLVKYIDKLKYDIYLKILQSPRKRIIREFKSLLEYYIDNHMFCYFTYYGDDEDGYEDWTCDNHQTFHITNSSEIRKLRKLIISTKHSKSNNNPFYNSYLDEGRDYLIMSYKEFVDHDYYSKSPTINCYHSDNTTYDY